MSQTSSCVSFLSGNCFFFCFSPCQGDEGDSPSHQQEGWDSGRTYWNGKGGGEVKLHHQFLLLLLLSLLRWWDRKLHQPGSLKYQRSFRNKSMKISVLAGCDIKHLNTQPAPLQHRWIPHFQSCWPLQMRPDTWVKEAAILQEDSLFCCLKNLPKEEDGQESHCG